MLENGNLTRDTEDGEIQVSREILNKLRESEIEKWIFIINDFKAWTNQTERKAYVNKKDSRHSVVMRRKSFNIRPDSKEKSMSDHEQSPEKLKAYTKLKKALLKGNDHLDFMNFKLK
jgi:hypothetical protein